MVWAQRREREVARMLGKKDDHAGLWRTGPGGSESRPSTGIVPAFFTEISNST